MKNLAERSSCSKSDSGTLAYTYTYNQKVILAEIVFTGQVHLLAIIDSIFSISPKTFPAVHHLISSQASPFDQIIFGANRAYPAGGNEPVKLVCFHLQSLYVFNVSI